MDNLQSAGRLMGGKPRLMLLAALLLLGASGSYLLMQLYSTDAGVTASQKEAQHSEGAMGSGQHQQQAATLDLEDLHHVAAAEVEKELGLRVTRLTIIAAGGLVDLRYQILDPTKAEKILQPDRPVYLLDEKSGKSVTTAKFPKLGELRSDTGSVDDPGRIYMLEFNDVDNMFAPGEKVSLVSGDQVIQHLEVR